MSNEPQITPEAKRTDEACRVLFGDFLGRFNRIALNGGGVQYDWTGQGHQAEFYIHADGSTSWAVEGVAHPANGIFNFHAALGRALTYEGQSHDTL